MPRLDAPLQSQATSVKGLYLSVALDPHQCIARRGRLAQVFLVIMYEPHDAQTVDRVCLFTLFGMLMSSTYGCQLCGSRTRRLRVRATATYLRT